MRYAGPREAIFHALVRKNYGITAPHRGARPRRASASSTAPTTRSEIFDRFTAEELGVTPLKLEPTFFCRACDSAGLDAHLPARRVRARSSCRARGCARSCASGGRAARASSRGPRSPRSCASTTAACRGDAGPAAAHATGGFILWFTGLSGAGKSTLAQAAARRGSRAAARVEILDGDEVRTHLSKGLGFSKEDRDTNIRRIGYVARLLARNGVAVITAAISPYADARDEVRRAGRGGRRPVRRGVRRRRPSSALVERDVKGLYQKALAGEIAALHRRLRSVRGAGSRPTSSCAATARRSRRASTASSPPCAERGLAGAVAPRRRAVVTRRRGALPGLPRSSPGRRVLVVGGGPVAAGKLPALAGRRRARCTVVAPRGACRRSRRRA